MWGWGWGSAEPKVRIGVAGPLDEHRVALPVPHVPCAVVHLASKHTWSGDSGRTGKAYTHNLFFYHPLQLQNPGRSGGSLASAAKQSVGRTFWICCRKRSVTGSLRNSRPYKSLWGSRWYPREKPSGARPCTRNQMAGLLPTSFHLLLGTRHFFAKWQVTATWPKKKPGSGQRWVWNTGTPHNTQKNTKRCKSKKYKNCQCSRQGCSPGVGQHPLCNLK